MGRAKDNPCYKCPRKVPACSARCPIEAEGGYGYDSWRDNVKKENMKREEYLKQYNEDYLRSEEFDWKRRMKGRGR